MSPLGKPPPKRVKRGHLLSDYRQKCVIATHDIFMSKARKITKNQTPWTPWIKSGLKWPKNDKKYDKNCIFNVSRVNFWVI